MITSYSNARDVTIREYCQLPVNPGSDLKQSKKFRMENDLAEIDKNQITTRRGKGKKRKSTINTDRKGFDYSS